MDYDISKWHDVWIMIYISAYECVAKKRFSL